MHNLTNGRLVENMTYTEECRIKRANFLLLIHVGRFQKYMNRLFQILLKNYQMMVG